MPKAGPYFLYMLDFKKDQEERMGRSLNMGEVAQMASDSWNAMSDSEKEYYKKKAKGGEVKVSRNKPATRAGQLTAQGVPCSLVEQQEREKRMAIENMRRRIGEMVQKVPLMTDFLTYPLYFMHANYFYRNNDGKYSPAEIGLVKFTFRDGVLKRHHAFIAPDKVETGYAYTAKAHSEESHRLPPPPKAFGDTDYNRVLYDIERFLKDDNNPVFDGGNPIIFTYHDEYSSEDNQVDVLNNLLQQFGDCDHRINIYPLTRLFYVLRNELASRGLCEAIPNEGFSKVLLSRDPYECLAGISCEFHEENDATRFCSLSRVRRWAFLMADHFCEKLGVDLVGGRHLPKNADITTSILSLGAGSSSQATDSQRHSSEGDLRNRLEMDHSIRSSVSTRSFDNQSVQTASSGSTRGKRPSRASFVKKEAENLANITSSTVYSRD